MKIVLVGGGSREFGPVIIRDILLSEHLAAPETELVLMDIVADHLKDNEAYAGRAMRQLGRHIRLSATTSLETALDGASFVIVALEVDRYLYWAQDFHVPRKYGFKQVYGENGGPGGIFHALRNIGPILHVARSMERICPNAWILNFSNPEHKVCEAISRLSSIRAVGLCHGISIGRHQVSSILGIPADDLDVKACGINHFTWFQTIRRKSTGEDLYPALAAAEREAAWLTQWHEFALGRTLFRLYGLWPSPSTNHYGEYIAWAPEFMASELNFYYDAVEGEPWKTNDIPEFVYTADHARTQRPWKPAPPAETAPVAETYRRSGELAIPIIESAAFNLPREMEAVNIRNEGSIPNLPADLVVEVPAMCGPAGFDRIAMQPLPEPVAAMMRTHASIHKLIVETFVERSRRKLLQTILLDPCVDSYRNAVAMMNELIELQKPLLPEFKD